MKKVTVKNKFGIAGWGAEMQDPTAWIAECVAINAWGKPERWVLHKDEPMAEAYDDADVLEEMVEEIQPAVDAVMELISPAIPAVDVVLDEQGVEISPAIPAVKAGYSEVSPAIPAVTQKKVKLKAEYTVEIEDITTQVAQYAINADALDYLASTDWLVIREVDAGTPCPADIKAERAAARARIIK
jgi:hypothetical protein